MAELRFIAFKGKSWIAAAIRYFTRSQAYSHIAVLMDDDRLIEAWPHKGGTKQWTDYSDISKHKKGSKYEIWSIEVTDEEKKHCEDRWIEMAENKVPYDYAGVIGFVFKKTIKENHNKLFCSEMAIMPICEYRQWQKVDPSLVSPKDFVYLLECMDATIVSTDIV